MQCRLVPYVQISGRMTSIVIVSLTYSYMNGPLEAQASVNRMCRNGIERFLLNLVAPDLSPQAYSRCH